LYISEMDIRNVEILGGFQMRAADW
jgi:hypothetical protein